RHGGPRVDRQDHRRQLVPGEHARGHPHGALEVHLRALTHIPRRAPVDSSAGALRRGTALKALTPPGCRAASHAQDLADAWSKRPRRRENPSYNVEVPPDLCGGGDVVLMFLLSPQGTPSRARRSGSEGAWCGGTERVRSVWRNRLGQVML